MRRKAGLLLLALAAPAGAQQPGPREPVAPLADNSFLVEEAYNQEPGVVQHMLLFLKEHRTGNWALGFTQEWPAWSERHQVSYSVPLLYHAEPGMTGLGDLVVTYRHQLLNGATAVAPRVSVLLPTGSTAIGLNAGGAGVQVAVPVSVRLSPRFSLHANAGGGLLPADDLTNGFVGLSLVTFVHPRVNLLAEWLGTSESFRGAGATGSLAVLGVRWGHDLPGGVQLVPGLGWAVAGGSERDAAGPVAYLSVEHRFR